MANRLQFVHHSECFATAEEAKAYVVSTQILEHPSLYAEPMVLCYGDEADPNIILAIGSHGDGTQSMKNKTFFIDSATLENDIEAIKEEISGNTQAIKELQTLVATVIENCGLEQDGKYAAPEDVILKTATTLKEADILLSTYVQEHNLSVKDTNTVALSLTDPSADGQVLSADAKLADHKTVNSVELPNIILAEESGLFANVDLKYDEEENKLTFSVNGEEKEFDLPTETYLTKGFYDVTTESLILTLNTGAEVSVDVNKLIGEWTVLGTSSSTPIVLTRRKCKFEDTLHDVDEWQDVLEADVRLLSDKEYNNILKKTDNGQELYVDGKAENIWYLKDGEYISLQKAVDSVECAISPDSKNIVSRKLDGIYANVNLTYNSGTNTLVFERSNPEGTTDSTTIQLNSSKILSKAYYDSTNEELILIFVTADGQYTEVKIPVSSLITEWEVDNTSTDVTLTRTRSVGGTDKLSAKVNVADGRSHNILETDNHVLWVDGIASNIQFDETYTVEGKIKALETSTTSGIQEEEKRAKEAEEVLNGKISDNTKAIETEKDRAISAETDIKISVSGLTATVSANTTAISDEKTRAEGIEATLNQKIADNKELIDTNAAAINANKEAINKENVRAVSAETELSKAIDDVNKIATANTADISTLKDDYTQLSKDVNDHAVSAGTEIHNLYDTIGATSGALETEMGEIDVTYDKASNVLSVVTTKGSKQYELTSASIIQSITYDSKTKSLVITYKEAGSEELHTVSVPVADFFNELKVDNSKNGGVDLSLATDENGHQVLSAVARLSISDTNLLKNDNGNLYASNQAESIKLADGTTVAEFAGGVNSLLSTLSGNTKISLKEGNIIELADGLYAKSSKLTYDTGSNTLTFTDANGNDSTIVLNSIDTIEDIYFDGTTDELVFTYTVKGVEQTVRIPAASFFKGIVGTSDGNVTVTTALTVTTKGERTSTGITANLDVEDIIATDNSTVTITKTDANKMSANVNIATNVKHNILEEDGSHSSLFVVGEASNIYCTYNDQDTNVQSAITLIVRDVEKCKEDIESLSGQVITNTNNIKILSGDVKENRERIEVLESGYTYLKEKVEEHDRLIEKIQNELETITSSITSGFSAIWDELERLDKKSTIVDDDENDYIKHTFSTNEDSSSTHYGNTMIHTELSEDLSRDSDSGESEDF